MNLGVILSVGLPFLSLHHVMIVTEFIDFGSHICPLTSTLEEYQQRPAI
jgi:hypothetical protein